MNVADFRRRLVLLLVLLFVLLLVCPLCDANADDEPLAPPASFADEDGPRIWYEQACVLAAELTQEPVVTVDC